MYESPFSVSFMEEVAKEVGEWIDDSIMKATVDAKITVDKDELVKALAYDRGQYDKGYGDGYHDGKRDARQWISVEERIPEDDQLVLCYLKNGKIMVCYHHNNWGVGTWDTWTRESNYFDVIAWMPLPEPPKEVER